jgi:hypothetical protein
MVLIFEPENTQVENISRLNLEEYKIKKWTITDDSVSDGLILMQFELQLEYLKNCILKN